MLIHSSARESEMARFDLSDGEVSKILTHTPALAQRLKRL